ncbi:MAG TPA: L,D-transpeptidase family protein [Longimicrobiales bacterium]
MRSGLVLGFMVSAAVFGQGAAAQHALASETEETVAVSGATSLIKASGVVPDTAKPKAPKPRKVFSRAQLQHGRVAAARYEKRFEIKQLFRDRGIAYPAEQVYVRIFKRERVLELWARPAGQETFALLKSYEICALSDKLGPKRKQGDMQTPEGFYYIDDFNPRSGFHLSLHIDYPNRSDRVLGTDNLGGNIFIHGGCKTEGCMAVTDENIKEIYWIAVEARDNGQTRIPVHIFPTRLNDNNMAQLMNVFRKEPEMLRFWSNLKPGYDYFAENKKLPEIDVNPRGRYTYFKSDGLLGSPTAAKTDTVKGVAKGND